MAEHEMPELTDELVTKIATSVGVSEEFVRSEYQAVQALGPEEAVADLRKHFAKAVAEIDEVAEETRAWLPEKGEDKLTNMMDHYSGVVSAIDDYNDLVATELLMQLTIATYLLAEAREQIAVLQDGSRRTGGA